MTIPMANPSILGGLNCSVTSAIFIAIVSADVSHLVSDYLPTIYDIQNQQHHHRQPEDIQIPMFNKERPSNELFKTTVEKHSVFELPTQIEIVEEGQPIYGISPLSANDGNENDTEMTSSYLPPSLGIEELQPPRNPYEFSMETYFAPVPDKTTTTIPPVAATHNPSMEECNTEPLSTTKNYSVKSSEELQEHMQQSHFTATAPTETVASLKNSNVEHMAFPSQNQYLPPFDLIMFPPSEHATQLTYQQYQDRLMHVENMEQRNHERELKSKYPIAEREQQTLEQPVAPLEQNENSYHYRISDKDFRRFGFFTKLR